ncbi:MAG: hypothetical protein J6Q54_01420, partial [Oscillospiraceae bacterium]|nr:hypothetical protein [Oscillospiraceae bacterium]
GDYPFVLGGSGTAEASLVGVYTQTETDKQSYQLAKSGLPVQNRLGKENAVGTMPITDAENGLQLQALRGLNFDDPLWESFLDQLSKRELVLLDAIASQKAMVYTPAEQIPGGLLSATYNPSLAYRAGKLLAYNTLLGDAYIAQIQVATEDGCLAGQMLKAQVQGICEIGVIALAEEHRIGADTEEKIAREQYLEPYKEAFANGIGGLQIHSGAVSILQEEWGFTGILPYEDSSFAAAIWSAVSGWENPGYISCLRDSCHRLLYNLVNSAAMNGVGEASRLEAPKVSWILWVYVLAALAWVFHIVMAVLYSIGRRNWKTSREYLDYQTMINTAVEA